LDSVARCNHNPLYTWAVADRNHEGQAMTTCEGSRKKIRPIPSENQSEVLPPKPDTQLWKTDKARALEVGARWFLEVSRNA
jgi:hypothetical protein